MQRQIVDLLAKLLDVECEIVQLRVLLRAGGSFEAWLLTVALLGFLGCGCCC